jgi:dTDP-L-rhamnose 4-epimerase
MKRDWQLHCPRCESIAKPVLTDEKSPFNSSSIYALSKQAQEQMSLLIDKTFGINTTILRFFLVYGSRQSLSNPYTGVCSIFASKLLNNQPAVIYEDGLQSRDFVHVKDICKAINLVMENEAANGEIFNVGTGSPITIKDVAEIITNKLNPKLKPIINQKYRVGDIRYCVADITKIKKKLGFTPIISFKNGIDDLINWIKLQKDKIQDKSQIALNELKEKGLLR